jgi:hypothetical protein
MKSITMKRYQIYISEGRDKVNIDAERPFICCGGNEGVQ